MAHFCQAVMLLASLSWYLSFPASSGLADAVEPGLIPQHLCAPSSSPSFLGSVRDFLLGHQPALKSWHRGLWSIINACSCMSLTNSYNWYQPVSLLIYVLPENFYLSFILYVLFLVFLSGSCLVASSVSPFFSLILSPLCPPPYSLWPSSLPIPLLPF